MCNEVASMVAERIRSAVESQQFVVRTGKTTQITISVGVACFPSDGETAEDLLNSANRAMQQEKHARKLTPAELSPSVITSIESFR